MAAVDLIDSPHLFDDHPSLSASLEDFEQSPRSPAFGLPSQHSGFKSEESESEDEPVSEEPWQPPAWRSNGAPTGWYRHQPYPQNVDLLRASASASRSRGTSYESAHEEDKDQTLAARIPLPRGSLSPKKERSPSRSPVNAAEPSSPLGQPETGQDVAQETEDAEDTAAFPEGKNNCPLPIILRMQNCH